MVKNLPANAGYTGSIPGLESVYMPQGSEAGVPQLPSPDPKARAPQQEKSLQREKTKSSPHSPELESPRAAMKTQ